MSSQETTSRPIRLAVENVGGIAETTVECETGVTVLEGRNATNRTSLLQAIKAACGSDAVSIKGDADAAEVTLTIDGETYERRLERENGTLVTRGDSVLDDPEPAELFAFLLESNEARRAVARGDDLREIIMRPVDTTAIQAEIKQLEARKRGIDDRLDEIADLERQLPSLEEKRTRLDAEIEETEETLAEIERQIDDADEDLDDDREGQRAVEAKLEKLRDLRSRLDDVRFDEETERESLASLREEREDLAAELQDLPDPDEEDVRDLRSKLSRQREEKRRLERKIGELNTVVQFNEAMLNGDKEGVRVALEADKDGGSDDAITDELLSDNERVTCWTCGSTGPSSEVEATIDLLKEFRTEATDEKDEVTDRIEGLRDKIETLENRRQDVETRQRRLDQVADEIETRQERIESLRDRRDELEAEIEAVQQEIDELRSDRRSELLDLHERANDLEYELGRLQNERDAVTDEIEEVEAELDEADDLEDERERVQSELVELRTRIDRIQEDAVEEFNGQMETVLDLLEYENLDRVWIERTETEVREGRGTATRPTFELHVIRSPERGPTYEDTVDHLSESEREVIGLVFALAGFLVHDVHETSPFILLDSLEALDAGRIATLVDHMKEYVDSLVVALLPEDARALDDSYQRIREI